MKKKWFLGNMKDASRPSGIWLEDFEWSCGWYWAGGYIGNVNMHAHFDGAFLNVPDYRGHSLGDFPPSKLSNGASVWEDLGFFLDNPQYDKNQWWRIKDLFKQFYTLKAAAEVYQYGGHCTSDGRTAKEINKRMAKAINRQIETVIIPALRKALDKIS